MLIKVISGGQTGCDRAALDAALAAGGLEIGGCVPKGRKAEDGRVPDKYPMSEMETDSYAARTRANAKLADGTLIIVPTLPLVGGTALTRIVVCEEGKPFFVANLNYRHMEPGLVKDWIANCKVETLNVAGPRESKSPGIYKQAYEFLLKVFK